MKVVLVRHLENIRELTGCRLVRGTRPLIAVRGAPQRRLLDWAAGRQRHKLFRGLESICIEMD